MDFLRLNIKHLRTINGLTQPQLAEILGVTRDNIASYERGTHPPVDVIHKFVNHFHIKFNDLIEKDLSTFESKNFQGVVVNMDRESNAQGAKTKPDPVFNEPREEYRIRSIEALEKVIEAQDVTIKSQQETIEALKMVIKGNSRPDMSARPRKEANLPG